MKRKRKSGLMGGKETFDIVSMRAVRLACHVVREEAETVIGYT